MCIIQETSFTPNGGRLKEPLSVLSVRLIFQRQLTFNRNCINRKDPPTNVLYLCLAGFRMRSLKKTVLLGVLVSVVLVLALLHSWPTRAYTTVDVWQRPGLPAERHLEEKLPEPNHQLGNIPFHVKDGVAR